MGGMGRAMEQIERLAWERSLFRPRDVEARGISRNWLPLMLFLEKVQQVAPGIYGRAGIRYPAVTIAATRAPRGVACLTTALQLHGWEDVDAREVWWAIPRSVRKPKRPSVPIRFLRIGPRSFEQDVERHSIEGVGVRVYSLQRTLADCVRWRSRLAPAPRGAWWQRVLSCQAQAIGPPTVPLRMLHEARG